MAFGMSYPAIQPRYSLIVPQRFDGRIEDMNESLPDTPAVSPGRVVPAPCGRVFF